MLVSDCSHLFNVDNIVEIKRLKLMWNLIIRQEMTNRLSIISIDKRLLK